MTGGRGQTPGGRLRLVLYGRRDCHLCDVAKQALRPLLEQYGVALVERDVDAEPEWRRQYGDQVPVGVIDGTRVFKYRVDPRRLRRAIVARLAERRK